MKGHFLTISLAGVMPALLLAGCLTTSSPEKDPASQVQQIGKVVDNISKTQEQQRTVAVDQNQRMAMMEREINRLRGELEILHHEGSQKAGENQPVSPSTPPLPGQEAGGTMEGTAARSVSPAQPPADPGGRGKGKDGEAIVPINLKAGGPTSQPSREEAKTTPSPVVVSSNTGLGAAGKGGDEAAPANKSPQGVYDEAFMLLKGGQYDRAQEGFEMFLKWYPNDALASNAQYWIGEVHYVQKRYPEAMVAYNQVLVRWPNGNKVPDSLLKIGFSFYELGDLSNARLSLEKLIKEFPDSSAVNLAKQRLKHIQQKSDSKAGTP